MGERNYLIEGVSGSGKTSVCEELRRRGYHAIHGDRELAYRGDPKTSGPVTVPAALDEEARARFISNHHVWDVDKVKALVADKTTAMTFFCGGFRNFSHFIDLFDGIFVLQVDAETMIRRLDQRAEDDWAARGHDAERALAIRLHQTKENIP